jgi:hypothetical protein
VNIRTILKEHSNADISTVSGYETELIQRLRKNQVDEISITPGKNGKSIPTKGVLEKRIVAAYEKQRDDKKKFNSNIIQKMVVNN